MSHFTKCSMKITNLIALKRALDELGHQYTEAEQHQSVMVRGWKGAEMAAQMSINMGKYDIGVVANADGTYDLIADWWGIETTRGVTEEEFQDTLNQRYSYQRVLLACEEKGYSLQEEVNEEDGTTKLTVSRWVAD